MKEPDNTSTTRIMPLRKFSEPVYIRLEDLEAFRELPTKSRIRQSSDNAADHK